MTVRFGRTDGHRPFVGLLSALFVSGEGFSEVEDELRSAEFGGRFFAEDAECY